MAFRKQIPSLLLFWPTILAPFYLGLYSCGTQKKTIGRDALSSDGVLAVINKVNRYWQSVKPPQQRSFWDVSVYHTGNMEAYAITKDSVYRRYSENWAEHNLWMGAKGANKALWKYSYGESDDFVLFGDWQACFQTYIDLYNLAPSPVKIRRAVEVMQNEMSTSRTDYWWWADGLYMVMPVMVKLYRVTGDRNYLTKLYEYWTYANSIMYDRNTGLYYRDANYVYPAHHTPAGRKDFWARGDGWVFAALAKVLKDLPYDDPHRAEYVNCFGKMAKTLVKAQQPDGYWTRSLLDPNFVPGPETSGTAFFTYGMLWGINNGYLKRSVYLPSALKGWRYLSQVALQSDGKIGYVQPIGAKAVPGQLLDRNSTANFGVGAFLLASCEMYRYLSKAGNDNNKIQ